MLSEITHPPLTVDSNGGLYDFICRQISADQALFGLLEFVRCEYCWRDTMTHFFGLLSEQIEGHLGMVEVKSSAPSGCDLWSVNETAANQIGSFLCSTCRHRNEATPHRGTT
jgi:hypothetical protein